MNDNELRSQSLNLLRFPLAVVVLVVHVFSTNDLLLQGETFTVDSHPLFLWVNNFIDGFLRDQSVPVYFFISGFVFFLGIKLTKETFVRKLKNRTKTLLIPYIIWNLAAVLMIGVRFVPWFRDYFSYLDLKFNFSLPALLSCFWKYHGELCQAPVGTEAYAGELASVAPINAPLWFLRDLMIVVLCTPLLYWLLKRAGYYLVILLGILWFGSVSFDFKHSDMLLTAFFFFSWGACLSIGKKDMLRIFGRYFIVSMILYPLLAVLYVVSVYHFPEMSSIIKRLNVMVGLIFAYNLAIWLLRCRVCKVNAFLASSAFFIYVSHTLICHKILKLFVIKLNPESDLALLSVYALTVLLTLALLLSTFYLLKRYAPGFLKILTGRKEPPVATV